MNRIFLLCCGCVMGVAVHAGETVMVSSTSELQAALRRAKPGDQILLQPGDYAGRISASNLHGTAEKPIHIAGGDRNNPPVIRGGNEGLNLSNPQHVELRDLVVRGVSFNGININDGGSMTASAQHIILRRVRVSDLDANGNHDAIKLSGVTDFVIEDCELECWGQTSGSGIDMVGCARGRIERCVLRHHDDVAGAANSGIQVKGGTRDIAIRGCRFERAGARAINIGGSTGLEFFRPRLDAWGGERWEARNIVVEGNTFIGSVAPVAFVGVDGAVVRFNTIYRPGRWALRILQETRAPGFVPSRNGVFADNLVVFRSDQWAEGGCNVGPGTAAETFRFERNFWYCEDAPEKSRPRLPSEERDGVYGKNPQLRDPSNGDARVKDNSPAVGVGADAWNP